MSDIVSKLNKHMKQIPQKSLALLLVVLLLNIAVVDQQAANATYLPLRVEQKGGGTSMTRVRKLIMNGATLTDNGLGIGIVEIATGETNTASNVGAATNAEIFVQKSGLDFEFNSLNGTEGIAVVNGANSEVTFALDLNNLTDNADLQAASDYAVMYDTSAGAHRRVELEHLANLLAIQDNVSANSAPINTDDSTSGYSVGSRWIDTTNNRAYICLLATAGSAVWKEISYDGSDKLATDGSIAMTGNLDMNSNKITNLSTPTASNDAATKSYVDSNAAVEPGGMMCGLATFKGDSLCHNASYTSVATCKGVNVASGSCPAGYTNHYWETGENPSQDDTYCSRTCFKN